MTPLYRRHRRLIASIAFDKLHDRQEAAEMVQEIFFEAYQKIDHYDPIRGKVKTWLMQFAYSRSLNRRQYLTFRQYYDQQEFPRQNEYGNGNGHERHHAPDQLEGLTFKERTRIIRDGISRLPEKQRYAIQLACFESLMMKDVAARMNETLINARNHYYRGLKRLRQIVDEMLRLQPRTALNDPTTNDKPRAGQSL